MHRSERNLPRPENVPRFTDRRVIGRAVGAANGADENDTRPHGPVQNAQGDMAARKGLSLAWWTGSTEAQTVLAMIDRRIVRVCMQDAHERKRMSSMDE